MLSQPSLHGTVGPCDRGASVLPSITIQHHHYVAFRNRYVGIRSTRPPTNQHPTTLLKCLTTGEPPSLFDMDGVTYAPGAPPRAMLGIPDQMGQFVCHSFTPLKSVVDLGGHRTPTRPVDDHTSQVRDQSGLRHGLRRGPRSDAVRVCSRSFSCFRRLLCTAKQESCRLQVGPPSRWNGVDGHSPRSATIAFSAGRRESLDARRRHSPRNVEQRADS